MRERLNGNANSSATAVVGPLRIVSDGDGSSTRVYTRDGHPIAGINAITIRILPENLVRAELVFDSVGLDITAEEFDELDAGGNLPGTRTQKAHP